MEFTENAVNVISTARHLGIVNYNHMSINDLRVEIAKKLGLPPPGPEPEVCNEYDCNISFKRCDGKMMNEKDNLAIKNFLKKNMSISTSRKNVDYGITGKMIPEKEFVYPFTALIMF